MEENQGISNFTCGVLGAELWLPTEPNVRRQDSVVLAVLTTL